MLGLYLCLTTRHDPWIVALAALVCAAGCYATFAIGNLSMLRDGAASRRGWSAASLLAASATIWSTHFIAMLAYRVPFPSGFLVGRTVLSFVVAISIVCVACWIARAGRTRGALDARRIPHRAVDLGDALHRHERVPRDRHDRVGLDRHRRLGRDRRRRERGGVFRLLEAPGAPRLASGAAADARHLRRALRRHERRDDRLRSGDRAAARPDRRHGAVLGRGRHRDARRRLDLRRVPPAAGRRGPHGRRAQALRGLRGLRRRRTRDLRRRSHRLVQPQHRDDDGAAARSLRRPAAARAVHVDDQPAVLARPRGRDGRRPRQRADAGSRHHEDRSCSRTGRTS